MVLRAYPQDFRKPVQQIQVPQQNRYVILENQPINSNNLIIKSFIVIGGIIILAYIAKKLFE